MDTIYGEEQKRGPHYGAQGCEMTGINVQKVRRTEHEFHGCKKTGEMVQTPEMGPEVKKHPSQEYVQCNADIGGLDERQDHEHPVKGVEKSGLKSGEERHSTKNVRVPQSQVPTCEFIEPEVTPLKELHREVRAPVGEHNVSRKKKDVPKHPDYQEQQCRKLDQIDPGAAWTDIVQIHVIAVVHRFICSPLNRNNASICALCIRTPFSGRILPEKTSGKTLRPAKPYNFAIENASTRPMILLFAISDTPPSPQLSAMFPACLPASGE
jgi:hypothetical protein